MKQLIEVVQEYETFLSSSDDEIRARARELELPEPLVAASLFALEEVRRSHEVRVSLASTIVPANSPANINIQHECVGQRLQVVRVEVPPEVHEHFLVGLVSLKNRRGSSDEWFYGDFLCVEVENLTHLDREFTGTVVCWKC